MVAIVYYCGCKDGYCGTFNTSYHGGRIDFTIGGHVYQVLDHGGIWWGINGRIRHFERILNYYTGLELLHEKEVSAIVKRMERTIDWKIAWKHAAYQSAHTSYYYLKDLARAGAIGPKRKCAWCHRTLRRSTGDQYLHAGCTEAWANDFNFRKETVKWARKQRKLLGKISTAVKKKDQGALLSLREELEPAPISQR